MKIWDTFIFNDELDLLECRLSELEHVVDYHVLVESTHTFRNKEKPLYYAENRERFARWNHKIITLGIPWTPGSDTWSRERASRDIIGEAVRDAAMDDLILLSDADEIPRASTVQLLPGILTEPETLLCNFYYLAIDWLLGYNAWKGAMACWRRDWPGGEALRHKRGWLSGIPNGGWHFSYCGGIERVQRKLQSFSHLEYDDPEFTDPGAIARHLLQGTDPLKRGGNPFIAVDIDDTYPQWIRDNIDQLQYLLRPRDV